MNDVAACLARAARASVSSGALALASALLSPIAFAQSTVEFEAAFAPATIGPGSVSTLEFTITNNSSNVVRDVAFTNALPPSLSIAAARAVVSDCGGVVDAPAGGGTIALSGAAVGAGGSCTLALNITGSTPGTHTSTSGPLTSELGSHGSATADLTVATDRPGFLKSFSPAAVQFGERSTLTLTVDNSANSADATNLAFTDELPPGMELADPPNSANTCGGTLSAPAGGTSVSLSGFFPQAATVAAGSSCTISVDVLGNSVGALANVTGELGSTTTTSFVSRSSGRAGAVLTVNADRIVLRKTFAGDPTPPGETVVLRYELRNLDRSGTATDITFTDDLDGALTGLSATGTPVGDPCGAGSSLSGAGFLSFSGGNLPSEGICTFDVTLQVPSTASPGLYPSETSEVSADLDGATVVSSSASDTLAVSPVPRLSAVFTDDPVGGGGSVSLEYRITNTSTVSSATDLAFSNPLDAIFVGASSLPANGFCGSSSTLVFQPATSGGPATIRVSDGSLGAGASCTFSVVLDVAVGAPEGQYTNTTSAIRGTVDGVAVQGRSATDQVNVVGGLDFAKEFIGDPVAAGDLVELEFTISHSQFASSDATGIAFTDDLDAVLSGLAANDTPKIDVCGPGSEISGSSLLSLTGGVLAPGDVCTFRVTLEVPIAAPPGPAENETSNLVYSVAGETVIGNAAVDELLIAGLRLDQAFVDDPALPGGAVTLRYTIENINPTEDAVAIAFSHNLGAVVSGLTAVGLPASDVCGVGSVIGGTGVLQFQNGNLSAGTSCTFDVTLQVPSTTADGGYGSSTTGFSGEFGGSRLFFRDAFDVLTVQSSLLALTKTFIDDPVRPGDPVTLRFELMNIGDAGPITGIGFTDDLEAALTGLASISGTQVDVCGAGSQVSGGSVLTLSGGTLAGSASCSFDVILQVPASAPFGAEALNTTSAVTGQFGGIAVDGPPASDVLDIESIVFEKSFDGPAQAGETVELTFSIDNLDPTDGVGNLKFLDDLSAMLPGVVAIGLPVGDVCGAGSLLEAQDGDTVISFSGGALLPAGSCSFPVALSVPASVAPGSYLNVTGELTSNGQALANPAVASLVVEAVLDSDGDGVTDDLDVCPDTVIPEGVPTVRLGVHRYALVDGDGIFDTIVPPRGGIAGASEKARVANFLFTIEDTLGCSCEQIIEAQGLGFGHVKFGCSIGALRDWIELVNP